MTAVGREGVVTRLASVLGQERAAELVDEVAREVGAAPGDVAPILDRLGLEQSVVGTIARLMRARLRGETIPGPAPTPPPDLTAPGVPSANRTRLIAYLSPSMGSEKAEALVDETLRARGSSAKAVSRAEGIAVLETLAGQPGLVGTVARFAKARAIMDLE